MREVHRSALVSHPAESMFALVYDIESYPEFLPWCRSARIHSRDGTIVEASLEMHLGELRKTFRTRNRITEPSSIEMKLVDGPFRHLAGQWTFTQLGESGSKVALDLEFDFRNPVVDKLIGAIFEESCNALVDAFTRRADSVYGGAGA